MRFSRLCLQSLCFSSAVLFCAMLAGCGSGVHQPAAVAAAPPASPVPPAVPAPAPAPVAPPSGVSAASVFTMNNSAQGNAVLAFARQADGTLSPAGTYPTGGLGSGGGLENQAALAFSADRRFLFVVNAGSGDFSVFTLAGGVLTLASHTPAGGVHPISIAESNGLVYVLHLDSLGAAEGADSISGFRIDAQGQATALANSNRPLATRFSAAAQVAIAPGGGVLLVTERASSIIDAFTLDANGVPSATPVANRSAGGEPFGFQFLDASHVLVSEEGTDATSSYTVSPSGALTVISASVPSAQAAVCWLAISPDGRFAFTGNTGSATLSGYSVSSGGAVALLNANGVSAMTDGGALDVTVSADGRFVYTVTTSGALDSFALGAGGGLTRVQSLPSLGALNGVISL